MTRTCYFIKDGYNIEKIHLLLDINNYVLINFDRFLRVYQVYFYYYYLHALLFSNAFCSAHVNPRSVQKHGVYLNVLIVKPLEGNAREPSEA